MSATAYSIYLQLFGGRSSIHNMRMRHAVFTAIVVASKEIGLDINADKSKYVVMFQDQNAR